MFAFLLWADGLPWVEVQSKLWRIGQFVAVVVGAAVLYFGALALGGFRLRQLLRR
jgi:putative peptidoglycan lipid II flippase